MNGQGIRFSFEFFPPRDAGMEARLWETVTKLAPLAPEFVSVTYGADGSTRERTHEIVTRIHSETGLVSAPHLTCVGASRGEVLDVARAYHDAWVAYEEGQTKERPQFKPQWENVRKVFKKAKRRTAGLA